MIELKTKSGELLHLKENSTIRLFIQNPMFLDDFTRDYSYPFNLDAKKNDNILGYLNSKYLRIVEWEDIEGYLFFNKQIIKHGDISIQSTKYDLYRAYLKVGANNFMNSIDGKTLKDLPFETYNFGSNPATSPPKKESYIQDCIINEYNGTTKGTYAPSMDYEPYKFTAFPIVNTVMFDGTNKETFWEDFKVWNILPEFFSGTHEHNYIMLFPYIAHIINLIFQFSGYRLIVNPFEVGELRKLVLCYMWRTDDYEDKDGNYQFNLKDYVPYNYTIHEFLTDLKKIFNFEIFFDEIKKEARILFVDKLFNAANHIDYSKGIIKGSMKRSKPAFLSGYLFQYLYDEKDEIASSQTDVIDLSNGLQEFIRQPALSPMFMTYEYMLPENYDPHVDYPGDKVSPNNIYPYIPRWEQRLYQGSGITLSDPRDIDYDEVDTSIKPRIMIWRGARRGYDSLFTYDYYYPMGNNSFYELLTNSFTLTYIPGSEVSLKWQDIVSSNDYGLYYTYFKNLQYFEENFKIQEEFLRYITLKELSELDLSKIHRIDKNNYLISKIDVTLDNKKIRVARIYGYRL